MRLRDLLPARPGYSARHCVHISADEVRLSALPGRRGRPAAVSTTKLHGAAQVADVLPRLLEGHAVQGVEVVVEAGWAQLWLLPFSSALSTEQRWLHYAQARFEQTFGASDGWDIHVAPDWPPRARLAAALPRALLAPLENTLGRRLRSVKIDALDRLAQLARGTPKFTGAALDVGPACAWLFVFIDGQLRRVRRRRLGADSFDALVAEIAPGLRSEWSSTSDTTLPELRVAWSGGDPRELAARLNDGALAARVTAYG